MKTLFLEKDSINWSDGARDKPKLDFLTLVKPTFGVESFDARHEKTDLLWV